jgi:hypothetical protein
MIGWIAWTVAKHAATYAAKDAARGAKPSIHPKTKKPNKSAILLSVATVVGVLALWKKKRSAGGADELQPEVPDAKAPDAPPVVSDTAGV